MTQYAFFGLPGGAKERFDHHKYTGIMSYTVIRISCQQLPALDPYQEIHPMGSYVSFEEHQQYLSADREHPKCFFAWNGVEEGKGDGTVDDTYYLESLEEDDQD